MVIKNNLQQIKRNFISKCIKLVLLLQVFNNLKKKTTNKNRTKYLKKILFLFSVPIRQKQLLFFSQSKKNILKILANRQFYNNKDKNLKIILVVNINTQLFSCLLITYEFLLHLFILRNYILYAFPSNVIQILNQMIPNFIKT